MQLCGDYNLTIIKDSWVVATQIFCRIFTPKILGKMSNLTRIFFRWVGSTTNQIRPMESIRSVFLGVASVKLRVLVLGHEKS